MSSEYRVASDGHPARLSGEWADDKLRALRYYLEIFTLGMHRRWVRLVYVDLEAGCGRCVLQNGLEFDGSPVIAAYVQPPFTGLLCVERDRTLAEALKARLPAADRRIRVFEADANDPAVIDALRRELLCRSTLGVAFIDMLGLEIEFRTIQRLTANVPLDLFITVQVSDLRRNVGRAWRGEDEDRFDRFFGTTEWRGVLENFERANLAAQNLDEAFARFYAQRLATLGYGAEELNRPMCNTKNAPLYRVMFVSKHPTGLEFFRKIAPYVDSQRSLF